ncbi:MAG: hypothetical protein WCG28_03465 [bacterium]
MQNTETTVMTVTTVARFVGSVKERCQIGGSVSLRGLYEISDPDGKTALYERHTSQVRGMGWNLTLMQPTHGRVWTWIGVNGYHSAVGAHVMVFSGPETVEVAWEPLSQVAYRDVALALAGRTHMPKWQRDHEPPNPGWQEVAEEARREAPQGWSLSYDIGNGVTTSCPDISAQISGEARRVNWKFDELLNSELLARAEWKETRDGREFATFFRLKDTDEETVASTIGFNCGITPDYNIPQGWKPFEASQHRLAEMRAEKARREAVAKEIQQRFMCGWEILRGRYQVALQQLGLTLGEDNHSLQNDFRIGAKNVDGVYAECPAGGKDGPHYRTSYTEAADWLEVNATTYDVASTVTHLLDKIQKAKAEKK